MEKALLAAGCIKASNFGDLSKLGWTRSSRTDRGVSHFFGFCGISAALRIDIHMLLSFFLKKLYFANAFPSVAISEE